MAMDYKEDVQWIWNDEDVIFVVFCGQLSRDGICSPWRSRIIVVPGGLFMQFVAILNEQAVNPLRVTLFRDIYLLDTRIEL